jgi:hypothetical protein
MHLHLLGLKFTYQDDTLGITKYEECSLELDRTDSHDLDHESDMWIASEC